MPSCNLKIFQSHLESAQILFCWNLRYLKIDDWSEDSFSKKKKLFDIAIFWGFLSFKVLPFRVYTFSYFQIVIQRMSILNYVHIITIDLIREYKHNSSFKKTDEKSRYYSNLNSSFSLFLCIRLSLCKIAFSMWFLTLTIWDCDTYLFTHSSFNISFSYLKFLFFSLPFSEFHWGCSTLPL